MTAILNVLFEITVYSAVLCAVILLFQKAFRKHISAALNYAIWGILILRLLVPVTIDSGLHLFLIPEVPIQVRQSDTATSDINVQPQTIYQPVKNTSADTTSNIPANDISDNTILNTQNKPAVLKIDWQMGLVFLWAAGAIGYLAYVAICRRRLNKKIERYEIPTPEYVITLVDKCKRDMRIKANIRVSVQGWIKSPALSSSIKPKLLIPEQMLESMDERQIEFGIRHELTHYKRKDHLVNYLLVILRCVYWFNPVIYFAFRRIQVDMETACDADITSGLESSERSRYIKTMIDLGGSNIQYVIGMGIGRGRKAMEKRIRGIFMKKRTGRGVRTAAAVFAAIMLMTCFTTACQPTPDKPVVVNKGQGQLNSAIADTAKPAESSSTLFSQLGAPQHWKYSTDGAGGKLKIQIDADVTLPGVSKLPAADAKLKSFTQDDINKVVETVLGKGLTFTEAVNFTKEQLEQIILDAQKSIADQKAGKEEKSGPIYDEKDLKYFQGLLPDAPSEKDLKTKDLTIESLKDGNRKYQGVCVNTNVKGLDYSIRAGNTLFPDSVRYIEIESGTHSALSGYNCFDGAYLDKPYGVSLTKDQAAQEAQAIASKLTDELTLCYVAPSAAYKQDTARNWGWACVFMRQINGCPTAYATEDVGESMDTKEQKPVHYEKMIIVMDDKGVTNFKWENPMTVTKIENDSVKLMSFDEISKRAVEQLINKHAKDGVVTKSGGETVAVTRVELGLMRVAKKNSDDYYYMPVWNFFNEITHADYIKKPGQSDQPEGTQPPQVDEKGNPYSILSGYPQAWGAVTLNALDGSVIDRDKGY